jgi:fibronectin-binding autotransporter adhesin
MRFIAAIIVFVLLLTGTEGYAQSTSWTGASNTLWSNAANWTNGVPTSSVNAVIGDASFTGSNQPTISSSASCLSLTVGGTVATTLSVNQKVTITGNVTINTNGIITEGRGTITLTGDWINSGSYSGTHTQSKVVFAGTNQAISGSTATAFRKITINAGSTVTLAQNMSVSGNGNSNLTVDGTFNPGISPTYQVTGSGNFNVGANGYIKVYASTFAGNYGVSGSITLTAGSTVDYASSTINQTISNAVTYSTLKISGDLVKTLAGNLPSLVASASSTGIISVTAGTLDLSTFTANRGATQTGGTLEVYAGATLKIGGTNTMPANYATYSFASTSNVIYSGASQTVSAQTYGNLSFISSSGAAIKTMPGTAFTIVGDFSSSVGSGTSVSYTALSNITFSGTVTIGSSTTFNGGSFSHIVAGDWINNGTFTGSTSTIEMSGVSKTISGSGNQNFNNLTVSGSGVSASSPLSLKGNLATTGVGTFTHNSPYVLSMTGSAKTISGSSITLNDLTVTGIITSTTIFTIAGNLAVNGGANLTTSGGSAVMSGTSKTITTIGTLSLYNLSVTGTITTASNFTISSFLSVTGSLTASAGTATFIGSSILFGNPNLYNVTINGTSLQLGSNSILGIANTFTISAGTLDVTSSTPNTVNFNGSSNKTIASGTFHHLMFTGNVNTAGGAITVNGNLTINTSTTFAGSSYTHIIKGNWVNNGTFTAGTSTIQFAGTADASITGATTFNEITINKSSSTNIVSLQTNIDVGTINMTSGQVSTGTSTLNITTTRTGNGIILGYIQRTHSFSTGIGYQFEGPYNSITFSSVSGVSSVLVKVANGSGSINDFPFGGSVNRIYEISIPSGTYTSTLRLHYEDAELNGNSESAMKLWRYNSVWSDAGKSGNDVTLNYVEQTGLTNITTRWTFSDDNNVIGWNGSVSSDWSDPQNWTIVQGSPGSIPTSNDVARIGFSSYTYAPVISTAAVAKSISFGSAVSSTLSLTTGGSLTTQGNIAGVWTANATHTINVNGQTITINGDLVLSDGTTSHAINLNIGSGTVTATGSVTESGGANITFTGSGGLTIGNNFSYISGTFTHGSGTVTYNGSINQSVAAVSYNNLVINNSAIASINTSASIAGNLSVTSGELDLNAATTITGNVTIASGSILNGGSVITTVAGNWSNSGTFVPFNSTVVFNGSGGQTISGSPFNNITISSSGTVTTNGNLTITGNVSITSGSLDIATYSANRSSLGGSLSISAGAILYVGGAANFPTNYSTYSLANSSTVNYNGTVAQTVSAVAYGNLEMTNGGVNVKTLAANTTINGDLTINSGATLSGSSFTIMLNGNWINNGTYTASTSTVNLTGSSKTITGNTTFNKLSVFGSYTISGTNITTNGLFTISATASLAGGSGTITITGNLTSNGSFTNTGTVTFSGTAIQTIQLTNTATTNLNIVNFNGSFSPVITATSIPTFATLNINNTTGVTASSSWIISTAFNIASGATFSGSSATHFINGSFTNNGTVNSSGTLNFGPTGSVTVQLTGTSFSSTGTIIFGGSGAISVTNTANTLTNITISNTNGVSPAANWTVNGNFIISNTGIFNGGSNTYNIGGNVQVFGTLNAGTSNFNLTSSSGTLSGISSATYYDLTITGTISVLSDYNVSHNFTNNGSYDGTSGTLIMTGSLPSTIGGTATTYNMDALSVQKSSAATATLAHNLTLVSSLDVSTGTFDASTFTISEENISGGSFSISNGATFKIKGTNTLPSFTVYSFDTLSNVDYAGTTQTVSASTSYGNLLITSIGSKTANAPLTILHDFNLTNGTFVGGSNTHLLGGSWSMGSGTFTNTGTTISFNGKATQNISSTGSFNNITVNKTSGEVVLTANATLSGTLTFTLGKIRTNSYTLSSTSGTFSGASQSTGWVIGNLQRTYSSSALSGSFPIGGNIYYSPATLSFTSVSSPGGITAFVTETSHPNILGSGITLDKNIPRYWTLINSGGVVYSDYAITLNWNIAENYPTLNNLLLRIGKYYSGNWSFPPIVGTPTTTSVQASGVTTIGEFAVGQTCNVGAQFQYPSSPYCTNGGSATVTYINGGVAGAFTYSPAGLSINGSTGEVNLAASIAGTYIVTNTASGTNPVGCQTASSASITITQAPSSTINYSGSPYCSAPGSATVTLTGTTGGTFSSTAGLSINSSTGTVDLSASTSGTYTVTYTIAASAGCAQYSTTTNITISGSWTGAISTNWNVAGNWACNAVPGLTTNVVIPSGLTNYPVISSGTGMVNNISIQSAASVNINGGTLQIAGVITNSGIIYASNGTIEMKGSAAQTIPAGLFFGNVVKNLTIINTSGVTLSDTVKITEILKAQSGTLNSSGYLVLTSDNSKTALIDGTGAGAVTGIVTMQRYLPTGFGYRYISSPFQGSQVSELANDLDLNASFPSLYSYDENLSSAGWENFTDPAGVLSPLSGFAANFGSSQADKTIDISGEVNDGPLNVILYNHNRQFSQGFNLVGNPYPSPIDWDAPNGWTKTNIDDAVYFFDNGNIDQYAGTYSSYINGVSSNGLATNIISSMQGFFVHVSNGVFPVAASLDIDNSVRINDLAPVYHKTTNDKSLVRLEVKNDNGDTASDFVVVYFDEHATTKFDNKLDALKLKNTNKAIPEIYALTTSGEKLSISALPANSDTSTTISLGVVSEKQGNISITAQEILGIPTGVHIYLVDAEQRIVQDLITSPRLKVPISKGSFDHRFFLMFSKKEEKIKWDNTSLLNVYSNGSGLVLNLDIFTGERGTFTVKNMLGQEVMKSEVSGFGQHVLQGSFANGIYICSFTNELGIKARKILIGN